MIDCTKCVHKAVCDLWGSQECQNAASFSLDGCDYFRPPERAVNDKPTVSAGGDGMKCNQICKYNSYSDGCIRPIGEPCQLQNLASVEQKMTNADRIRAMSDEEFCGFGHKGTVDWLQQPPKEDTMSEYIERAAMRQVLKEASISTRFADEAPAADVEQVVHGRWDVFDCFFDETTYQCSVCKEKYTASDGEVLWNYCSNCGAKMDLEEGT